MRWDLGSVMAAMAFVAFGVLFLLHAQGVVTLRPGLVWPPLLLGWGATVLAGALQDDVG